MKRTVSGKRKSRLSDRSKGRTSKAGFAICVDNREYPASLERGKVYKVLADSFAHSHGLIRVVDESGEDYIFSQKFFRPIILPKPIIKALTSGT